MNEEGKREDENEGSVVAKRCDAGTIGRERRGGGSFVRAGREEAFHTEHEQAVLLLLCEQFVW